MSPCGEVEEEEEKEEEEQEELDEHSYRLLTGMIGIDDDEEVRRRRG